MRSSSIKSTMSTYNASHLLTVTSSHIHIFSLFSQELSLLEITGRCRKKAVMINCCAFTNSNLCFPAEVTTHTLPQSDNLVSLQKRTKLVKRACRHSGKHSPRKTQESNVRSKILWFTRSCNSHYVSHFAAFFIVVGAKTSVAESCMTTIQENKVSFSD